jgi:electron transfer flavoprotein beta subunit
MKILCLIKFVPDVEDFQHREKATLVLNPDDACAVAYALLIKRKRPETVIEVVTMAPRSAQGQMEDLVRRKIDRATLISDRLFAGSDTLVTSTVLARYLQRAEYDVILTGTRSLDGDTSQVPAQVAERCGLPHVSNIVALDQDSFAAGHPVVDVDLEASISSLAIDLPAVLGLSAASGYKLPYVAFADLKADTSAQFSVVSCNDLGFEPSEVGLEGSKTRVRRSFVKKWQKKSRIEVKVDAEGIETVHAYLQQQGFLG